jgi:hypothetical protein
VPQCRPRPRRPEMLRKLTLVSCLAIIGIPAACSPAQDSPARSDGAVAPSQSSIPQNTPTPTTEPTPNDWKAADQIATLHADNVKSLPLARSFDDIWDLQMAIATNQDDRAAIMKRQSRFVMVPNDSQVRILDDLKQNGLNLHTRVKVLRTGQTGWVSSTWLRWPPSSP